MGRAAHILRPSIIGLLAAIYVPSTAALAATATPGATYEVAGGYLHGGASGMVQSQPYDTGPQATGASLTQGGADSFGGGSAQFTGVAEAGSLHAAAVAFADPQNSSLGGASVTSTLTDHLVFGYTGAASADPIAVRVTLYLDSNVGVHTLPASARVMLAFDPAANTSYFNTGLQDYDFVQGAGDGSLVTGAVKESSAVYYIPADAAFDFRMQLTASANAAVGYDYTNDQYVGNTAGADASHTGYLGITLLTPGTSFTSASGASYDVAPVPEPGIWAMLLGGLGLTSGIARRRVTRSHPRVSATCAG